MNIFYLDNDPVIAAQMQCDKHVVKMILESAQMLSTAHRVLDGIQCIDTSSGGRKVKRWKINNDYHRDTLLYKATHVNHPSNIWTRQSKQNYIWHYNHFCALCDEYTYRYEKVHSSDTKLRELLSMVPNNISDSFGLTPILLAMPKEYHSKDLINSYRNYYQSKNSQFNMSWKKRNIPSWFLQSSINP